MRTLAGVRFAPCLLTSSSDLDLGQSLRPVSGDRSLT